MENVFSYFFYIGCGVSMGLTVGAIPALVGYRYMKKREANRYARQTTKART